MIAEKWLPFLSCKIYVCEINHFALDWKKKVQKNHSVDDTVNIFQSMPVLPVVPRATLLSAEKSKTWICSSAECADWSFDSCYE